MTVSEGLALLSYGTEYKALSARTGKKLFDSYSTKKHREKFLDWELTDAPFFAEFKAFKAFKDSITGGTQFCKPIIAMWIYDRGEE